MVPYGGANTLQGSNVQLLRKLIDVGVFERMAEAREMDPAAKGYTGIDMLYDLNDGLFRELAAPVPVVEMYRRNLQRNYVLLLMVAAGVENDPQAPSKAIDSRNLDSSALSMQARHVRASDPPVRPFRMWRSNTARKIVPASFKLRCASGRWTCTRRSTRQSPGSRHPATLAVLRELKARLERMP